MLNLPTDGSIRRQRGVATRRMPHLVRTASTKALRFQAHRPYRDGYQDFYRIDVRGLGGLYFVRANEFDDSGFFDSLDAAADWVGRCGSHRAD